MLAAMKGVYPDEELRITAAGRAAWKASYR